MRALFLFLVSIFVVGSCSIPEVQESEKGFVIIASDFLSSNDSLIFKNFEKSNKTKVHIKHLSTDSIISHVKQFGYNTQFDGVLLFSSYSMNRLSNLNFLNELPDQLSHQPKAIRAPYNKWICIGFDPYVIDFKDSIIENVSYHELTYGHRWKSELTKEQSAAFYASVLHQFGRKQLAKSMTWLKEYKNHEISTENDSLKIANFTLNRYSIVKKKDGNFIIPNQDKTGAFFDGIGIGMLTHTSKYTELERLISYLLLRQNNQGIMAKLDLFPLENPANRSAYSYQNKYPKLCRCTPNKCVSEYREMEKILKNLNRKRL